MKEFIILFLILLLFAVTIELPDIDITGLFLDAASSIIEVITSVINQIISTITNMLSGLTSPSQ